MNDGKLPPNKLYEREVDQSNVTLNTFLGAARQKSWMLRGETPVRPTPRSTATKLPLSQASNLQRLVVKVKQYQIILFTVISVGNLSYLVTKRV